MNEELMVGYLCARCRAPVDDFNLAEAQAEGFDAEECDILCRNCSVEKTLKAITDCYGVGYKSAEQFVKDVHDLMMDGRVALARPRGASS